MIRSPACIGPKYSHSLPASKRFSSDAVSGISTSSISNERKKVGGAIILPYGDFSAKNLSRYRGFESPIASANFRIAPASISVVKAGDSVPIALRIESVMRVFVSIRQISGSLR